MELDKTFLFVCCSRTPVCFREKYKKFECSATQFSWMVTIIKERGTADYVFLLSIDYAQKKEKPSKIEAVCKTKDELLKYTNLPYAMFEDGEKDVFSYYGEKTSFEATEFIKEWFRTLQKSAGS